MCETCKALADSLENTRLEVEGAIAIVTMDRPKALNALSDKTLNELDRIFTLSLIHISEPTRPY